MEWTLIQFVPSFVFSICFLNLSPQFISSICLLNLFSQFVSSIYFLNFSLFVFSIYFFNLYYTTEDYLFNLFARLCSVSLDSAVFFVQVHKGAGSKGKSAQSRSLSIQQRQQFVQRPSKSHLKMIIKFPLQRSSVLVSEPFRAPINLAT